MLKVALQVVGVGIMGGMLGCGSTSMTPTGPEQQPRAADCDFQIFTTMPKGYAEVGAIDVKPGGYGHKQFTDLADFKEEIRASVCKGGGDAAIAYANGLGMYIKATVLKQVEGSRSASSGNGSAQQHEQAAEAPAAGAPTDVGCRFDTQCKGDRICVKGECVDGKTASPGAAGSAAVGSAAPAAGGAAATPAP